MGKEVMKVFNDHKAYFENWHYGDPVESWRDRYGNLCVRYASGTWFHYRYNNGCLECW